MTPQQIELVQTSFKKVVPIAGTAADLFYDRLFEIAPPVRALFPSDITEQKVKLMAMLGTAVTNLHQLETILPAVKALGERHQGVRRHRRSLRACRRRASLDARERPRRGFHARDQGGLGGRLHHARRGDDVLAMIHLPLYPLRGEVRRGGYARRLNRQAAANHRRAFPLADSSAPTDLLCLDGGRL